MVYRVELVATLSIKSDSDCESSRLYAEQKAVLFTSRFTFISFI